MNSLLSIAVPTQSTFRTAGRLGLGLVSLAVAFAAVPEALRTGNRYTFTQIATTTQVPTMSQPNSIGLNNHGVVAMNLGNAIWTGDGTTLTQVTTEGSGAASINDAGQIAYGQGLLHPTYQIPYQVLLLNTNGTTVGLASSLSPPYMVGHPRPWLTNDGRAVYSGANGPGGSGPTDGIFIAPSGPVVHDPWVSTAYRSGSVSIGAMNDAGVVVFRARLPDDRWAIVRSDTAEPIAADNTSNFLHVAGGVLPVINNHGRVAFFGMNAEGLTKVWTTDDGVSFEAAGDDNVSSIAINDSGLVAYQSNSDAIGNVIAAGPSLNNDRVIGFGDPLDGSTVNLVFLWPDGLNNNGQVAFWARLADGREGVYRADPVPVEGPTGAGGVTTVTGVAAVSGTLNAVNPQGGATTFALASNGVKGTAEITNPETGAFTYAPHAGAWGYDSFTFTVNGSAPTTQMIFIVADRPQWPGQTVMASRRPGGGATTQHSFDSSLSADGRYVAFGSQDAGLVAGDTNGTDDVFVWDRATGAIERVSVASDGTQANGQSGSPVISADGQFVTFFSLASNLAPTDGNGAGDVFLHNRTLGTTTVISVAPSGQTGNGKSGGVPTRSDVSADGRFVLFSSEASDLVPDDTNSSRDVFLRDLLTGFTTRLSVGPDGTEGTNTSNAGGLSADGAIAVFASAAANLVPDDTNGRMDIFVWSRASASLSRVNLGPGGAQANADSSAVRLSADGRTVVFSSGATNLVDVDTNGALDIFAVDLTTMSLTRVSTTSAGAEANGVSGDFSFAPPASSADGRFVAFFSQATNLASDDPNGVGDIYVKDRHTGEVHRVSLSNAGAAGNSQTLRPAISADGRFVSFDSNATTLTDGDTNGRLDVFVVGGVDVTPPTLSFPAAGGSGQIDVRFAYPGTPWSASTPEPWITASMPVTSGDAVIPVTVSPNSGEARTGKVTVALQPVVVTQDAQTIVPGEVVVNTNGYEGEWVVGGITRRGSATITLPVGSHQVRLTAPESFEIVIDAAGTVTVPSGGSAVGGPGQLTFLTTPVAVDPAAYLGEWSMQRVDAFTPGPRSVTLVRDQRYLVNSGGGGSFWIRLTADGRVDVENGVSAVGGPGALTFNVFSLTVDPGAYTGRWRIDRIVPERESPLGAEAGVTVVAGTTLRVVAGASSFGSYFDVVVGADGSLSVPNGVSATAVGSHLTFLTHLVNVQPGAFTGQWFIARVSAPTTGPATIALVRGLPFFVSPGIGSEGFIASLDGEGRVTVANGASGIGGQLVLNFNTIRVRLDPTSNPFGWIVHNVTVTTTGPSEAVLVPGVRFLVRDQASSQQLFAVDADCVVVPATFQLSGHAFVVSCETADVESPILSLPAGMTVTIQGMAPAVVTYAATATDNVDAVPVVTCSPASGTVFSVGLTTVTCSTEDRAGNRSEGTFDVTVVRSNRAPLALTRLVSVVEDGGYGGGLQPSDPDGDALTFSQVTAPTKGTLALQANGAFSYIPFPNLNGPDSFTYRVSDGDLWSEAVVTVAIEPVNDAPTARPASFDGTEDMPLTGQVMGSDVDGDTVTLVLLTQGRKGRVTLVDPRAMTFQYTPALNATGPDDFTVAVSDGRLLSPPARVSVWLAPVNDAPLALGTTLPVLEDLPESLRLEAIDPDRDDTLTFTVDIAPKLGTILGTGSTITYSPNANANGSDRFRFRVSDGHVTATAWVTVLIGPDRWRRAGPGDDGDIRLLTAPRETSGLVYAASSGAIARTTDGGMTWSQQAVGSGDFIALVPAPGSPKAVWALSRTGSYRTSDGGGTWVDATGNLSMGLSREWSVLAVDAGSASTAYVATALAGAFGNTQIHVAKTIDAGQTWTGVMTSVVPSPASVRALVADPVEPGRLLLATSVGLFQTVDGGSAWSRLPGLGYSDVAHVVFTSTPGTWYAVANGLWRTSNFGNSWTRVNGTDWKVVPDSRFADLLWAVGDGRTAPHGTLWQSNDEGRSWSAGGPDLPGGIQTVALDGAGGIYVGAADAANASSVFQSADGGATWRPVGSGLRTAAITDLAASESPEGLDIAIASDGVWATEDRGRTWTRTGSGLPIGLIQPKLGWNPLDARALVVADNDGRVYQSNDRGTTWQSAQGGLAVGQSWSAVAFDSQGQALLLSASGALYASEDNGASWILRSPALPGAGAHHYYQLVPVSSPVRALIVTTSSGVYRSADGGVTWATVAAQGSRISVDPTRPARLYLGTPTGVSLSTNGGSTWTALGNIPASGSNQRVLDVVARADRPSVLYALTHDMAYRSTDGGATWYQSGSGITASINWGVSTERWSAVGWPPSAGGKHLVQAGDTVWALTTNGLFVLDTSHDDLPVAANATYTTPEDRPFSGRLQATDPDGDSLLFSVAVQGSLGTLTITDPARGAFRYVPKPNAVGVDTIRFNVGYGAVQVAGGVRITISPVNDAPVAEDFLVEIPLRTLQNVTLRGKDVDGDDVQYQMWLGSACSVGPFGNVYGPDCNMAPHGDFPFSGTFSFNAVRVGEWRFKYRVWDGQTWSKDGYVTIRVR